MLEFAELAGVCSVAEASGPGFLNLTVADEAQAGLVSALAADPRLGMPAAAAPQTVVVD